MTPSGRCKLVVLYGIGGLSDVGRHAILAALENETIDKITVITEYPEKLNEANWDCGCVGGHANPFDDTANKSRLEMVKIDTWKREQKDLLAEHFAGAAGVVACLGHRQPGWKYPELITRGLIAYDGNRQVIDAMNAAKVDRAVVVTSFALRGGRGATSEWPHWASVLMGCFQKTCMRKAGNDLARMEAAYVESPLDYLLVRPVGISEDKVPVGRYYLQQPGEKKSLDGTSGEMIDGIVGGNMAKMDAARFMVNEAIRPTLHRTSRVVGSKPGSPM